MKVIGLTVLLLLGCAALSANVVLNGATKDSLFLDTSCPIDGRNYLSSFCQEYMIQVNNTLGISLSSLTSSSFLSNPAVMNSSVDQQLIGNFCHYCANEITNWINAFTVAGNVSCLLDAVVLKTVCSEDPYTHIECVNHIGNYALKTYLFTIVSYIYAPTMASLPSGCSNISCCEVSLIDSVISLGKQSNLLSSSYQTSLQKLQTDINTACPQASQSCTSLLVQQDTPTPKAKAESSSSTSSSSGLSADGKAFVSMTVITIVACAGAGGYWLFTKRRGRFQFANMKDEPAEMTTQTTGPTAGVDVQQDMPQVEEIVH